MVEESYRCYLSACRSAPSSSVVPLILPTKMPGTKAPAHSHTHTHIRTREPTTLPLAEPEKVVPLDLRWKEAGVGGCSGSLKTIIIIIILQRKPKVDLPETKLKLRS